MFDLPQPGLLKLQAFFHDYSEALQSTALLFGGPPALQRTQLLLDDISVARVLTRRLERELCALRQLLSLKDVGEFDGTGVACVADLYPESPITAEICLLCDAFADRLEALGFAAWSGEDTLNVAA